jgi:hypothetical protein
VYNPDNLLYSRGCILLAAAGSRPVGSTQRRLRAMRKEVQEKEARLFQELKLALEKSQALALSCLA